MAESDDEKDDDDDAAFCSEHTLSLRKALAHCQRTSVLVETDNLRNPHALQLLRSGQDDDGDSQNEIVREAVQAARSLKRCRRESLDENKASSASPGAAVDVVPDLSQVSKREFQQRYLMRNRPCLVRRGGVRKLNGDDCFSEAQSHWTTTRIVPSSNERSTPAINRDWFRTALGQETLLPVRYQQQQQLDDTRQAGKQSELDEDGRAAECQTKQMKLSDWILLLNQTSETAPSTVEATKTVNETNDNNTSIRNYYLKDWHLQSWLERQQHSSNNHKSCALTAEPPTKLYSVPDHFQCDLLNDFLLRFTKGDYRFVYWGPAGSRTTLHSDVMNSYSWSYNVHGVKDWTFFLPDSSAKSISLRQHAGELVFVPSTWKHCVVNVEETLSINHNWITTYNLDLVWECIMSEIGAVDAELTSWGVDSWEAKENMLRGCLGLDVSAFFYMCLTRSLDLLQRQQCKSSLSYEDCFDLVRLCDTLADVIDNTEIALEERLETSLNDKTLSLEAVELAKLFIQVVRVFIDSSY